MAKRYAERFVPALSETVKWCEKGFQVVGDTGPEIEPIKSIPLDLEALNARIEKIFREKGS